MFWIDFRAVTGEGHTCPVTRVWIYFHAVTGEGHTSIQFLVFWIDYRAVPGGMLQSSYSSFV